VRVFALGFEEFVVIGRCRDHGTVDGDICGDGVSRRSVDVEREKVRLSVESLVVMCGKGFSS
jgi:hypothetical protein